LADTTLPSVPDGWQPVAATAVRPLVPAVAFAVFAGAAAMFFAAQMWDGAFTEDFAWLWRTGELILADRRLPAGDPFSWTAADRPLVLYQWLFMALVAGIRRVAGPSGLFAFHVAAAAAIYLLAPVLGAVPRRVPPAFTIVLGAAGLAIVTVNLSLRPMVVTSAALVAQYALIQAARRRSLSLPWASCLVAVLYAAWANLHNGFVLGLGSLALFAFGDLVERCGFRRFEPEDPAIEGRPLTVAHYAPIAAVAFAASLANPYGFGLYEHLAAFSSQPFLSTAIQELHSPDFHLGQFRWFLLLIGGFALVMMRGRRALGTADILHLAVFTLATLGCARFVVWAAAFYVLILPRALHHALTARPGLGADLSALLFGAATATRRGAVGGVVAAVLGLGAWLAVVPASPHDPCDAVGPALAAYGTSVPRGLRPFMGPEAGSCAIARAPGVKVFIDTRFDFYGEELAADAIKTLLLERTWKQTLRRWRVDRLIVEKRWPLAQALAIDPDFRIVYADDAAVIAEPVR
jgi:hypothetical protein